MTSPAAKDAPHNELVFSAFVRRLGKPGWGVPVTKNSNLRLTASPLIRCEPRGCQHLLDTAFRRCLTFAAAALILLLRLPEASQPAHSATLLALPAATGPTGTLTAACGALRAFPAGAFPQLRVTLAPRCMDSRAPSLLSSSAGSVAARATQRLSWRKPRWQRWNCNTLRPRWHGRRWRGWCPRGLPLGVCTPPWPPC